MSLNRPSQTCGTSGRAKREVILARTLSNHWIAALVLGFAAVFGSGTPSNAQNFQLTPFGGWRYGGSFVEVETGDEANLDSSSAYGLILGIPWNEEERSYLELLWSHQGSTVEVTGAEPMSLGLDIDYLHLGGTVPFNTPNANLDTLLSGGVGATFMRADVDGASSELAFSISLAGGLLYHVSPRVGIRLDLRGWYTITSSDTAIFCAGGCIIAFSGSGFGQIEMTGGVQISF